MANPPLTCSYDGEWFYVGTFPNRLAAYPRQDGTFSIGRNIGPAQWYDVETGFENIGAAIDHAEWLVSEQVAS